MPVRPVEVRRGPSMQRGGYTSLHARRSASLSSSVRAGAARQQSPRPVSAMSFPVASPHRAWASPSSHAGSLTAAKSPSSPLALRRAERVARDGLAACRASRQRGAAPTNSATPVQGLKHARSASAGSAGSRRRSDALQAIAAAPIAAQLHGVGSSPYAEAFCASALAGQHSLGADTYVPRQWR